MDSNARFDAIEHRLGRMEATMDEMYKTVVGLRINGAVTKAQLPVWKWLAVFVVGGAAQYLIRVIT